MFAAVQLQAQRAAPECLPRWFMPGLLRRRD